MFRSKYYFYCFLFLFGLLTGCNEEIDPAKEAEQKRNQILEKTIVSIDYKIEKPKDNLPNNLKLFSGVWVGKWNEVQPSRLIITKISSNEVSFIYAWGANPQKNIDADMISRTVAIRSDAKIIFEINSSMYTFVVDTLLNKVIGARISGDIVSNIVMEKVENANKN